MRWIRHAVAVRWARRELTTARWHSNPFQTWATLVLGLWSLLQLVVGVTQDSVLGTIDRHAQALASSTNLFGAIICLAGLHMRDLSSALWVEVIGYVSLLGSLGLYVYLVVDKTGWLNTAYGYGLVLAFCVAGLQRTVQVFRLKRAERRAEELRQLVQRARPGVTDDG